MESTLKTIDTSNGNLVLLRPSIDDAADIINFLNKVAGETNFLTFGLNDFPYSLEEEKDIIINCLEQKLCFMLIAKIDNKIAAQLFLQRSSKSRLLHSGDIGIAVAKQYWGRSIGKNMMKIAIEWAQQNNITKLQLQVRSDNSRAIQLYERLGFVIEGKITRSLRINSIYFDDYIMGLQF